VDQQSDFTFSPLSAPRKFGRWLGWSTRRRQFSWLELSLKTGDFPKLLKIKINNPEGHLPLT